MSPSVVALQPLSRQQIVGRPPSRQRRDSVKPCRYRRMTDGKIEARLLFGKHQIPDHRNVGDRRLFAYHEGKVAQVLVEYCQKVV